MIQAFGVARFGLANGVQAQKLAPQMIREVNEQLIGLGLTGEDVITIYVDEEFYHVFYYRKAETQPTTPQV
jgi:predicted N-acetyltransferase YhbS